MRRLPMFPFEQTQLIAPHLKIRMPSGTECASGMCIWNVHLA
jgi:hypothetical protein